MTRVLIADDHVVVRNGLKHLLASMADMLAAGEAGNGEEVLEALRQGQFDLLLLDLTMPGLSGIKLIERIRAADAKLPILVLSMHEEFQVAKRVLQAGATGFVTKGSNEDTLKFALRTVAAGKRFVDSSFVEQVVFMPAPRAEGELLEQLSERERQIMRHLAKGQSLKSIAEELFISDKTVSTHKMRLMRKMNFASDADLVRYAIDHGLID